MIKLYFATSIKRNWNLVYQFTSRDIVGRYKSSQLGMTWTVINPLIMLSVYTLVFSQIFKARWGVSTESQSPLLYALNLFAGLIVFNIFAECATRGPTLITSNPNYVKKIIFPLEILGIMVTSSAVFHGIISGIILVCATIIVNGSIPIEVLILPIIWAPLILGCLGMTWVLAAVGVFIRDINQLINSIVSMFMFLSPIFYPSSALPEKLQWVATINPLALSIEQTRGVLINGTIPGTLEIASQVLVSIAWCEICYRFLKKCNDTFGDLL